MTRAEVQIGESREAAPAPDFKSELLGLIPFLRAFARSLTGNYEAADDLVQETLVKAWQSRDTFELGTNLKAWLFTILRNQFYSDRRRAWRQAPWDQDAAERMPGTSQDQNWAADLSDTARALRLLPDEQREALILVGAGGFSTRETLSRGSGRSLQRCRGRKQISPRPELSRRDGGCLHPISGRRNHFVLWIVDPRCDSRRFPRF